MHTSSSRVWPGYHRQFKMSTSFRNADLFQELAYIGPSASACHMAKFEALVDYSTSINFASYTKKCPQNRGTSDGLLRLNSLQVTAPSLDRVFLYFLDSSVILYNFLVFGQFD